MQTGEPDFYLGSTEHRGDLARARRSFIEASLTTGDGRRGLVVRNDPPIIGDQFGLRDDISEVLLIPRYRTDSFEKTISYPMPVLIFRPLKTRGESWKNVRDSDVKLAAWGEIYANSEDAAHAADNSKE